MERSTLRTTTRSTSYLESLAHSLIQYANTNADFASWFQKLISTSTSLGSTVPYVAHSQTPLLTLTDDLSAMRRAEWVLFMVEKKQLPKSDAVLETLVSWSRSFEETEPRAAVLGLKYGIINFGIWGHPGKRFEPMDILVREDIADSISTTNLTKMCITLSHSVIETALLFVQGNAHHLEPEVADWLFGEKNSALHKGSQETLHSLKRELDKINALYTERKDEKGTTYLAVSPALYLEDVLDTASLTKIT